MITLNRPALPAELVERLDAAARPTRHGPTNPDAVAAALEPFLGRPGLLTPTRVLNRI
jgi:hypothetical protein